MQSIRWEQTGVLDQLKRIYRPTLLKLGRMKELSRKIGVLVGLALPSVCGATEAGVRSPHGAIVRVRGETLKAESETAGLWQPEPNENQTVLATVIYTLDRAVARSWNLGIVVQSQGEGCCWLQRDGSRGCEGVNCGGRCLWRKTEKLAHQTPDALNSRVGPDPGCCFKWLMHQTTEEDPRRGAPLCAWCAEQQRRTLGKEAL